MARSVTLREGSSNPPALYLEVFIEGPPRDYARVLAASGCRAAPTPGTADVILFPDGPPVDPVLCGKARALEGLGYDKKRDDADVALYHFARKNRIPMIGCGRGAVLLHVMNGGTMYQEVTAHRTSHGILYFPEAEPNNQTRLIKDGPSSHRQGVVYQKAMEVLAVAHASNGPRIIAPGESDVRHDKVKELGPRNGADIEAFFYGDTGCLGLLGLPCEWGNLQYEAYFTSLIAEFLVANPALQYENKLLRVKPDVLN